MYPANATPTEPDPQKTSERPSRLSLEHSPKLRALLDGPDGAAILLELEALLQREPARAPRYARDLFARVRASPDTPPEVAVVRDLSRSGVRLELGASAHLDAMHARPVLIEVRLPGMPFARREATLVRVVERRESGVELAFAFVAEGADDPAFEALLARLAEKTAAR